ncbi:hypothetical protein OK074_4372 [Actinobacteria bacterium OK074]|nr:hypothetical protein OK074_4372 [Actinobacteria bacterium OK074]
MTVARIAADGSVDVERVEERGARSEEALARAHAGTPPGPDPAPVTTIARRLGHLHFHFAGGWERTFGGRAPLLPADGYTGMCPSR